MEIIGAARAWRDCEREPYLEGACHNVERESDREECREDDPPADPIGEACPSKGPRNNKQVIRKPSTRWLHGSRKDGVVPVAMEGIALDPEFSHFAV